MRRSTSDAVTSGKGLKGGHELKRLKVPTSAQVQALTSEQVKALTSEAGASPAAAPSRSTYSLPASDTFLLARRHAYARITVCAQTRAGRRGR